MSGRTAVMYEKVTAMSVRIRKILEGSGASVIEADSTQKLYGALLSIEESPALVLLDLDIREEGAAGLIEETKKRSGGAPVIILTGEGTRGDFLEAFAKGAEDFIIKPFADQILVSKANKYLNGEAAPLYETVSQGLDRCIAAELRKAEKGKFPVSFMFLSVRHSSGNDDPEANKCILVKLKNLLWDTDLFVHFGSGYYFGIFPFCDEKNTAVVDAKLSVGLDRLKTGFEEVKGYNITSVFVSYPFDSPKTGKIIGMLKDRVREVFGDLNIAGF